MSQAEEWDIISGIGLTALGAAGCRATESTRPDRLINDEYAARFVAAAHAPFPLFTHWPLAEPSRADPFSVSSPPAISEMDAVLVHGSHYIGLRTRFFDDFMTGAVA